MSVVKNQIEMNVTKRNGQKENVSFDKILSRVKKLGAMEPILLHINYTEITMKVIDQLFDGITTKQIDELTSEQCASLSTSHPDYSVLASRVVISNHHKNTEGNFKIVMTQLYNFTDIHHEHHPIINEELYENANTFSKELEEYIDYERDYLIDYFGFKTLERAYLMRINGRIIERPQHMWMRVALAIHNKDIEKVKETYDFMSQKYFTHATPTLFNAGTPRQQMSSCYLLAMENDSIKGIYNTLADCAAISKWAGGIGLHIHNVRASGSHIRGTNGKSNGIVPMLRVFNNTARYVDQGGGRRNGSFAIYLEPWHADIEDFLQMRKNHGDEEMKARDLFYALWIPDLFMKRVKEDKDWTLMCPDKCPGLSDVYGMEFEMLYEKYEAEEKGNKTISARALWFSILDSQIETGTPYMLYKDAANKKSNQQNIGTIKSSNLCCEIIEYSDKNETAVCNLASIGLPMFVKHETFDFNTLHKVTKMITNNLNKIIDLNFYPTDKTNTSNMRNRPIGIGIQGLADVFALMDYSFDSIEARQLNIDIFETMYHAALEESCTIAKERGHYSTFKGSPASEGILQFDLWNVTPSGRYNWAALKENIKEFGLRNSLLLAPMPTASTSQILGNNECFEPFTSNIYVRRTLAGEFIIINKHLMKELIDLNLWNEDVKNSIISNNGSIQSLSFVPNKLKEKYRTVWELPMKSLIEMSRDRGAYICQSQSLNLWMEQPSYDKLTAMHFFSWKQGLKTGLYYLRTKAKAAPQQFTIDPTKAKNSIIEEDDGCLMCSG